jgi:NitT/TauT family transport system substrate-binding protein
MLRRTLLLSFLAPALAALACSRRRLGSERITLRVATSPYLISSPFYVSYEAGYFKDAGFDVELMKEMPSLQSIPLLAAGKQDVGFVGMSAGLLNAVARGARVRIVAAREIASPSCKQTGVVYVRTSEFPNGIRDMRQLRRHRISVTPSTTATVMFGLDKLLEHAGMSRSDVEIKAMNFNEEVAALRGGSVDAMVVSSIDMTPMLQALQIAPGPGLADVLPGFQCAFIVFGARLLDGDVRSGALFLRAYLRGLWEFQAGKTPAFMDEYARSRGLDQKLVRAGCRDAYEHDGRIHLNDIQAFMDWAASHDSIPHPMSAQSVVDTRFLDALPGLT